MRGLAEGIRDPLSLLVEVLPHRFVEIENVVIVKPVEDLASDLAILNESSIAKRSQLVGHSGLCYRKMLREIAYTTL